MRQYHDLLHSGARTFTIEGGKREVTVTNLDRYFFKWYVGNWTFKSYYFQNMSPEEKDHLLLGNSTYSDKYKLVSNSNSKMVQEPVPPFSMN